MKTLEEFVKEINASEELQKEIAELKDKASLEAFLKVHGCNATVDEFAEFVETKKEGEIGDEAAENVSGGLWCRSIMKNPTNPWRDQVFR